MSDDKRTSNLTKRVLVGVIGIPLLLFIFYKGGYFFFAFSLVVEILCLFEFYNIFKNKGIYPLKSVSIFLYTGLLTISFVAPGHPEYVMLLFILSTLLIFTFEIFRTEKRSPLNPVISAAGFLYITLPLLILNLFYVSGEKLPQNFNYVIYIFVLIWVCDTFAYFGGRLFGKHKLSTISPKKTIEGSISGFIFTIAAALIFHLILPDKLNTADALITGSIIGTFGQIGDLFESMLKRYCDVKDSSNIIPGHGGVLDRFDSLIFVAPLIYIYFFF
ncbi:MAG TPA: phosphatidate cytidylyltransferase [Ignavibacteria bacterium]